MRADCSAAPHGGDIDGGRGDRRHGGEQPASKRSQRPVEDVEGGCPAADTVADDDARTQDRRRQLGVRAHQLLGLELRLLIGVVKRLTDVEVALGEAPGVIAGDVGRRDVAVAIKTAALAGQLGEVEHLAGAGDVDLTGLLQR